MTVTDGDREFRALALDWSTRRPWEDSTATDMQVTELEHMLDSAQDAVAAEREKVRKLEEALADYDAALAACRLPGRDNDGGHGNLLDEVRALHHNWAEAEERVAALLTERASTTIEAWQRYNAQDAAEREKVRKLVEALERVQHLAQPVFLPLDNGICAVVAAALAEYKGDPHAD